RGRADAASRRGGMRRHRRERRATWPDRQGVRGAAARPCPGRGDGQDAAGFRQGDGRTVQVSTRGAIRRYTSPYPNRQAAAVQAARTGLSIVVLLHCISAVFLPTPRSRGTIMHASLRLMTIAAALACLAGTAQAADKVKVGLLTTLSGPGAALGIDIRDGFELAVKQAGGKLGGLEADVIVADDQMSPDAAKQAADRLVKRDRVDFMTGVVFSNIMLAVGQPVFQSKTFYISANAGPSQYAGAQCNPYFFSASYQNDTIDEAAGK